MTTRIKFTKMHGTGNDYIYVDTTRYPIADPEKKAIEWSKFHTGIGSDGLILIGVSDKADFSMRIFNADGSEAMMCGNGSRGCGCSWRKRVDSVQAASKLRQGRGWQSCATGQGTTS